MKKEAKAATTHVRQKEPSMPPLKPTWEPYPGWAPYCLRCSTMLRMEKMEYGWRCKACGNQIDHDCYPLSAQAPSVSNASKSSPAGTEHVRQKEVAATCARSCRHVMRRYALMWRDLRGARLWRRASINLREAKSARDRALAYECSAR